MLYLRIASSRIVRGPDALLNGRDIRLLGGENQREPVLSDSEEAKYLAVAAPLLKAVATIMIDYDLRPEEVHRLRFSQKHPRRRY